MNASAKHPSPYNRLSISADVGGTFADCLASWFDQVGRPHSSCIKILSTGTIRCRIAEVLSENELVVDVSSELKSSLPSGRLPQNFFRSAILSSLDDGIRIPAGRIIEFDSDLQRVLLGTTDSPDANDRPPFASGQLVELDCGLEAPVLATRLMLGLPLEEPFPPMSVRLGTTRGTNALLTRSGVHTGLVITHGFGDLLRIGEQDRPELFDLAIEKPSPLSESVLEIDARMDHEGNELSPVDTIAVQRSLETLKASGAETLSICLMHSYLNPAHELIVADIAQSVGFKSISRSSEVAPLIKLVPRTETTTLDAYLNPLLQSYVQEVRDQFGGNGCELHLMTSGGNLVSGNDFRGRDSVLSGPAGGVVGLEQVVQRTRLHDPSIPELAIGLDMGGTSTDVSRYDGQVGRRYETRVAGLRVMTPMMDIHTVAAGGGSICDYQGKRLVVGPASAGASPGPACYGRSGPLCVTDVNLLLGRLLPDRFPFPLDVDAARTRLEHVASRMTRTDSPLDAPELKNAAPNAAGSVQAEVEKVEVLAEGFLDIAVTHMAEAVRAITTARGVDVRDHALVGFGGAAAQHLCRIADSLGMKRIIDHPKASVLSAVGIGTASLGNIQTRGVYQLLKDIDAELVSQICKELKQETVRQLHETVNSQTTGLQEPKTNAWDSMQHHFEVDCRYLGTDSSIELPFQSFETLSTQFHQEHQKRFGYERRVQPIELVAVRCEAKQHPSEEAKRSVLRDPSPDNTMDLSPNQPELKLNRLTRVWSGGQWHSFHLIDRGELLGGQTIPGGSVVFSDQSTLIVEPNWAGSVDVDGTILLQPAVDQETGPNANESEDAVQLEIVARRLQSIADSMGEVLRRTSVSVNVKERLDFSCAVFLGDGTLVANAPHVPVHLGAMGHTVRAMASQFPKMADGDCYVSNDPYAGGSHLPDVTVVTPVFCEPDSTSGTPDFFVASRAHHAEIGGISPGSMPPMARSLAEEGVLIRAFAFVRNGASFESELREILSSGRYPSRNVDENLADLRAQVAAGRDGANALQKMVTEMTLPRVRRLVTRLLDVAAASVERWIATLPDAPMTFQDELDDGTPVCVRLQRCENRLEIDFDGTAAVHEFGFNATPSIVNSAILYVLRCFCDSNLPLCDGVMRNIDLNIPSGLLNPPAHPSPEKCAAVVAGNVETSQRIVDVLLGAIGSLYDPQKPVFRSVAASQGTMNNVLLGDASFGYYETIGGGAGATVFGPGADAVHSHMTNTRITDPEILESRLPVRLTQFSIRNQSGGTGKRRGGNGAVREFEFLRPLTVSLITGRRTSRPYGAAGGGSGQPGENTLTRNSGDSETLPYAATLEVHPGDRLKIETPGGGGWGAP